MTGLWTVAAAASLTLGALLDSDQGQSLDADVRWMPTSAWSIGAGVGQGKSGLDGADFSGTSLRASTDVYVGGFDAGVSLQRWKDSSDLKTRSVRAQAGWTFDSGIGVHALLDDRSLDIRYSRVGLQGQVREASVGFDGTGYGAELSFTGMRINAAGHFIDYGYGQSVARVRNAVAATDTTRFPRLQLLVASVVTSTAGGPDREIGLTLGREFNRSALQGEWLLLRDALTREETNSLSLIHSYRFSEHIEMDTTLGFSQGDADGTLAFGGVAVRFR